MKGGCNMNIFIREMKANGKSLLIWCIGVLFMVAAGMGKYAGMSSSSQSLNKLMAQMPEALRAVFGVSSLNLSTAIGFYGMLYLYLVLMATIHASMLGSNIMGKEERDRTAEFLYTKPASRKKIITSKLLAALVCIVIFNITTLASSIAVVGHFEEGQPITRDIGTLMAGMFMLQLIFLSLGTALAAACKNPKAAASSASAVLLAAFMLSVAIDMNPDLDVLKYLTPFKYFEAKNLMFGGGLDAAFTVLSVAVIAVLLWVTYGCYEKRDLNA